MRKKSRNNFIAPIKFGAGFLYVIMYINMNSYRHDNIHTVYLFERHNGKDGKLKIICAVTLESAAVLLVVYRMRYYLTEQSVFIGGS